MTLAVPRPSLPMIASGMVHLCLLIVLARVSERVPAPELTWVEYFSAPAVSQPISAPAAPAPQRKAKSADIVPVAAKTRAEEAPAPASTNETTVQESTSGSATATPGAHAVVDPYRAELERLLRSRRNYPSMALRLRQQGTVVVRFAVSRDGRVLERAIIKPSPHETLNKSALALVDGISGLKPFPAEAKEDSRQFIIPIEYRM